MNDPHPTWVSYYADELSAHELAAHDHVPLPAHSLVRITIYQYDGDSGLRNPFISQAQGTVGGAFVLNGKPTVAIDPATASHVFAVPQLGVSVPLHGVADNAKNPCGNAPCGLNTPTRRSPSPSAPREPVSTAGSASCPCAAGYIQGFGGPMQTVGYMDGFIKVV